jgi:spore maturation protein CgeB
VLRANASLDIVFIGLAVTSSWGNGHATTYRSLLKGLSKRGHRVTFLEQDAPWYAAHRDQPTSRWWHTALYRDFDDLRMRFAQRIREADAVIVGSYVEDGRRKCDWVLNEARGVRAFYDIDTPVTLRGVESDSCQYLARSQVAEFDVMLSFTGGSILSLLEERYGAKAAHALYCSVDVDHYVPRPVLPTFALGYMGTYSNDRQPGLEALLNVPARKLPQRKFLVVGAQYPASLAWPANVERREHVAPSDHPDFYAQQRFTLNVTRADMKAAGHSPSVRLFEAAACGTPIISDDWPGIDEVFVRDAEILIATSSEDVCGWLSSLSDAARARIGRNARERVISAHSGSHRAEELEAYIDARHSASAKRVRATDSATQAIG